MGIMSSKNKTTQPPMMIGNETFGQRLARIRKEKGFTQVELAEKLGIIQVLVSDYERDKLRPYHEMISRFSQALDIASDELLGLKPSKGKGSEPSLKILRRLKKIEDLPSTQQKFILKTIDSLLKAAVR
jgi:transcriptional regulator with XRE-family HTH domain